jgi:hypothetical protein
MKQALIRPAIVSLAAAGLASLAMLGTASAATAGPAAPAAAPAAPAAATRSVSPDTVGCTYEFNNDGVYIRAYPDGLPINGEGYTGQTFFSYPFESEVAGGLVWVHGTDLATGVGGWSAAEYLTSLSCHNY